MERYDNKIGIFGGTFNPIHCGHLIIAEAVREKMCLDKVIFIPSGQPPHKPDGVVIDAESRFELVRRAVSTNRFFEASRMEIDREGFTYTINTLTALREAYGRKTGLFFIIGADIIPELTAWKDFRSVFKLCEFIAVPRPGYGRGEIEEDMGRLRQKYGLDIHMVEAPLIDISSSDIRKRCGAGRTIKYLVPESVEEYIMKMGLYGQAPG